MDKALSFFRVFDLAFFVPGAAVYWALHTTGWLGNSDPLATPLDLSTGKGLAAFLSTIGFVYILGLCIHTVQRVCFSLMSGNPRVTPPGTSWYQRLGPAQRAELAYYFWYMRATCWNLAIAFFIATVIFGSYQPAWPTWVAGLSVGALLLGLGCDYDKALHRAVLTGSD